MLMKYEQGVGLLEVLIALLLLAVAVLGFSAMQMRSIQATDETLTRSDAMVIIRNISEDLRLYPKAEQKKAYIDALTGAISPKDCVDQACSEKEQVEYNAAQAKALATASNIQVSAMNCPGAGGAETIQKLCLIASWNETAPNMEGGDNSCTNQNGTYKKNASCIVMETY